MTVPIHLYDRSRVTTDWKCGRARFHGYELGRIGVRKASTSLELFTGTTIHDAMATIANWYKQNNGDVDIDAIASAAFTQMHTQLLEVGKNKMDGPTFAAEQASLVEGLIRGFYKHVWPILMREYPEILFIEQEMTYEHDGMIFMAKPDLIVSNGEQVVYIEYKSTKTKKEEWIHSWDTAIQLHSTCRAVKASTGVDVDAVRVVGLYKGYESYGKQSSPFCYGYHRSGNPPFTQEATVYEYKPGFKRVPTWETPGGVKAWVESMPSDVLANQFPLTPPIMIDEDMVDRFFRQRAVREGEIQEAVNMLCDDDITDTDRQSIMDQSFPQKFDQCIPPYGRECEFRKLCFGDVRDPLSEGFEHREPHHQLELERFNAQS